MGQGSGGMGAGEMSGEKLRNCAQALINLDASGSLVPHGIGNCASGMLADFIAETARLEMELRDNTREYPILVVCALIVREGCVLMERHAPDGINSDQYKWDIPGGKVECGETPEAAVIREIREELEVEIQVDSPAPVLRPSVWVNKRGQRHWILAVYRCSIVNGEPVVSDDLQWVPLERVALIATEPDASLIAGMCA